MHPEERAEVHGGEGVAVVEVVGQAHAHVERAQDRGPTKVKNGKNDTIFRGKFVWFF